MEKRILRLYKGGTGILKIGKALGIGTGTVQRVVMEQPRPFDVGASAEGVCLRMTPGKVPVEPIGSSGLTQDTFTSGWASRLSSSSRLLAFRKDLA